MTRMNPPQLYVTALLAGGVLAGCGSHPDYDQPPTPDRPVRLIAPSASSTAPLFSPTGSPSESGLQAGVAVPGAYCSPEGARRVTPAGAVATCSYGPDEINGGLRLEWTVAPATARPRR